jgi:hypothetical protein
MRNLAELIKLSKCPYLNEKYKGIAALPLDLPRFELDSADEFWRIWNEESELVNRQHIDRGGLGRPNPNIGLVQWDGLALYEDPMLLGSAAWLTKLSKELGNSQPNYLKSIFENLPFVKIRSVRLWSANKNIPAHYDGNMPSTIDGQMRFPAEIRIMLDDKNPKETFWLCSAEKHKPSFDTVVPVEDRMYVKLPNDTNTFCWNNEDFLHGADFNPQYRKILVVVKGWVDLDRLELLLDKSIAKYPDYVIKF